ncbi:hypothetical protein F4561_004043 [Lipingzhangella halophila]|uniref:Uncharacterized protein n=1 Tax=Lipingzhangella halophila TaxID=1783352 RepID=A0A7W7W447_9ACTN|nr:hypothetical protein [Lipingzhangella halophila]MBB4933223.1 hypothetical protein [Lipingzhangella halophila]
MSERSPRAREISDFLAALRHRTENPSGETGSSVDLLAWKSSLLDRIAADSEDPETRVVAAEARADLAAARSTAIAAHAHDEAQRYQSSHGGEA